MRPSAAHAQGTDAKSSDTITISFKGTILSLQCYKILKCATFIEGNTNLSIVVRGKMCFGCFSRNETKGRMGADLEIVENPAIRMEISTLGPQGLGAN